MKYIVTRSFNDAKDNKCHYDLDSEYPNRNMTVSEERINFLIENGNIREKELSEYNLSELVEKAIQMGLTLELNADNYNFEYLRGVIEDNLKNDDELSDNNPSEDNLNGNVKLSAKDMAEKKKITKKLKALKVEYTDDMSLEELRELLNSEQL